MCSSPHWADLKHGTELAGQTLPPDQLRDSVPVSVYPTVDSKKQCI